MTSAGSRGSRPPDSSDRSRAAAKVPQTVAACLAPLAPSWSHSFVCVPVRSRSHHSTSVQLAASPLSRSNHPRFVPLLRRRCERHSDRRVQQLHMHRDSPGLAQVRSLPRRTKRTQRVREAERVGGNARERSVRAAGSLRNIRVFRSVGDNWSEAAAHCRHDRPRRTVSSKIDRFGGK